MNVPGISLKKKGIRYSGLRRFEIQVIEKSVPYFPLLVLRKREREGVKNGISKLVRGGR